MSCRRVILKWILNCLSFCWIQHWRFEIWIVQVEMDCKVKNFRCHFVHFIPCVLEKFTQISWFVLCQIKSIIFVFVICNIAIMRRVYPICWKKCRSVAWSEILSWLPSFVFSVSHCSWSKLKTAPDVKRGHAPRVSRVSETGIPSRYHAHVPKSGRDRCVKRRQRNGLLWWWSAYVEKRWRF